MSGRSAVARPQPAPAPLRIPTDRFGVMEVAPDRVVAFPDGIPGFADCRRFVLVEGNDTGELYWLQAADRPWLAFLCAVPWAFFPEYAFELPDADAAALGVDGDPELLVLTVLTVPEGGRGITANLLGPVVVDVAGRNGRQVVMAGAECLLRVPLPG